MGAVTPFALCLPDLSRAGTRGCQAHCLSGPSRFVSHMPGSEKGGGGFRKDSPHSNVAQWIGASCETPDWISGDPS